MILKKLIIAIFFLGTLNGCAQNTALLGPIYTMSTTGNVYQAGLSYGSDRAVTSLTGKSTGENVKELLKPKKEDSEFQKLVKKRITETRKKLNLSNQ
jgi:hypothetical protein|tara:strand:- start:185 stop:475 length:291 start_codon:yes stop_codon:yes gene_type:complete